MRAVDDAMPSRRYTLMPLSAMMSVIMLPRTPPRRARFEDAACHATSVAALHMSDVFVIDSMITFCSSAIMMPLPLRHMPYARVMNDAMMHAMRAAAAPPARYMPAA